MIFVTVGAQMPFDRLVSAVDEWCSGRAEEVFAQIGATNRRPANMKWTACLHPSDYRRHLFEADAVITHAGMGTILTALELGKPIVVMPRRGDLRETRNDHQVDTARAFAEAGLVAAAWDQRQLKQILNQLDDVPAPRKLRSHASPRLLAAVRNFVEAPATVVGARQPC